MHLASSISQSSVFIQIILLSKRCRLPHRIIAAVHHRIHEDLLSASKIAIKLFLFKLSLLTIQNSIKNRQILKLFFKTILKGYYFFYFILTVCHRVIITQLKQFRWNNSLLSKPNICTSTKQKKSQNNYETKRRLSAFLSYMLRGSTQVPWDERKLTVTDESDLVCDASCIQRHVSLQFCDENVGEYMSHRPTDVVVKARRIRIKAHQSTTDSKLEQRHRLRQRQRLDDADRRRLAAPSGNRVDVIARPRWQPHSTLSTSLQMSAHPEVDRSDCALRMRPAGLEPCECNADFDVISDAIDVSWWRRLKRQAPRHAVDDDLNSLHVHAVDF